MPVAEMPVARSGDDGATDVAIFPDIDPHRGKIVRGCLIQDVGLLGIVECDIGDPVALFVVDGHGWSPPWLVAGPSASLSR